MRVFIRAVAFAFIGVFLLVGSLNVEVRAQTASLVIYLDVKGQLYSVPTTGGDAVPLTPKTLVVERFRVLPNGFVVVVDSKNQIYSIPVAGGTPTRLDSDSYPNYEGGILPSADGEWIVYITKGKPQLMSVSIRGGDPVELVPENQTIVLNPYEVHSLYTISPDNKYVLFTAKSGRGVFNLFAVPIAGGDAVQINDRLASGGNVVNVRVSGDHVVYSC
ncbi:MAG: hypothetical protein U0528_06355 [Anaerolineae bacterium]